jgi:hypothetical protein
MRQSSFQLTQTRLKWIRAKPRLTVTNTSYSLNPKIGLTVVTTAIETALCVGAIQCDRIESKDRLLDEIERDACGIAGLFEVETSINGIDQGE